MHDASQRNILIQDPSADDDKVGGWQHFARRGGYTRAKTKEKESNQKYRYDTALFIWYFLYDIQYLDVVVLRLVPARLPPSKDFPPTKFILVPVVLKTPSLFTIVYYSTLAPRTAHGTARAGGRRRRARVWC